MEPLQTARSRPPETVGIVGGGIAGLYTAALLKQEGIEYRIFEGTGRAGGRVRTHYFDNIVNNQYFEAGAMRIPKTPLQKITFDLIDWVNHEQKRLKVPKKEVVPVELIPYNLTAPGNLLFVNGVRSNPSLTPGNVTPKDLDWPVDSCDSQIWETKRAQELLEMSIGKFKKRLEAAARQSAEKFEKVFSKIIDTWDDYSFRHFLKTDRNKVDGDLFSDIGPDAMSRDTSVNDSTIFPDSIIDFLETVTSQTNQFALSVPELIMQNLDFGTREWKTIDRGMSRLPAAMINIIGRRNIVYGARVTAITNLSEKERRDRGKDGIAVVATGYNGILRVVFDAVVLAIPPAALKMLVSRPRWSPSKEMAIRSIHFEPLYKMGLRFRTRFWEIPQNRPEGGMYADIAPSHGGQSTTDIPIRWIVYPSNDLGDKGPGVLMTYAWMTDATTWVPLSPIERRSLAIHNLIKIYGPTVFDDEEKKVRLEELLIETADAVWSESTATGDAMFLPGQFRSRFNAARQPETINVQGDPMIYFAGEHISYHHTWISGAADSALWTVRKLLGRNIPALGSTPDGVPVPVGSSPHSHTSIGFEYTPNDPLHLRHGTDYERDDTDYSLDPDSLPLSLGDGGAHGLGAEIHCLRGAYAGLPI